MQAVVPVANADTDMILRNAKSGGVEVYDINNNQRRGLPWHCRAGLAVRGRRPGSRSR